MKYIIKRRSWMRESGIRIKAGLIAVCLFISLQSAIGQSSDSMVQKYSFIKYGLNEISFPGDSERFEHFMKKFKVLHESGLGQINIVQIGGSHVQADMWTGRLRENFNRMLNQKESARGIIFPYKAVKTNGSRQFDITFNKPWDGYRSVKLSAPDDVGLMGWKATARDSGQYIDVTLTGDTNSRFVFDMLRIFHVSNDQAFQITVTVNDSVYTPQYFDSCKCSEVNVADASNRFILTVHKTDSAQSEFILHGIQTMLHKPLLMYHSVGVNGASVSTYLNCKLMAEQIRFLDPDLIIFSIGINDSFDQNFTQAGFESNYSMLVSEIQSSCPDVAFMFITNTDSYKRYKKKIYKNLNGAKVQKAMFNLGKLHHAAVWDLYGVMGGSGSIISWRNNGLAQRDLIHLTQKGYYLVADLMFDAFYNKYKRTPQIQ